MWSASTGVIHCVFNVIPNLQNCFITSNKKLGGEGASDKYTLATKSFYRLIFKKSRYLGLDSISYLVHGMYIHAQPAVGL